MIYLVTNNPNLIDNDSYKVVSVAESLKLLEPLTIVGLDTETSGIEVHTKDLLLVQLGCKDFQVVIDCRTVDITLYKKYLESDRLFLLWNAKFDLKFFLKYKIIIPNIYDGFLAEKLLWLGYEPGQHSMSLKSAGEQYLGIELDKSVRGKIIWCKMLTDDIIIYGADDVKYLEEIRDKQLIELKKKGLVKALAYENKFCIVLAYTEFCGVKLDVNKWKEKMKQDQEKLDKSKAALNKYVEQLVKEAGVSPSYKTKNKKQFNNLSDFVEVDPQGDLFLGFDTTPHCCINWSSPKQVIPVLEYFGFNLETFDKKTKEKKKSVGADIIEAQKDVHEISTYYIQYKEAEKLVGTYGQNIIDQINPATGRIHTNFNQLGASTGRLSSGGKDKEHDTEYVNFQNFPRDALTRSCFIAEDGNMWISCDYAAQESRVIADIANDQAMLDLFNIGCGDMHSLVAKKAYPNIIGDCPVEEIKTRFKKWRGEAKGVEFAINYGGDANTIQKNKNIPLEEAKQIYDDYMRGFPGVKRYQDKQKRFVMDNGWILINPQTGHKAFVPDWGELSTIQEKFNPQFWATYREYKKSNPDCTMVEEVRKYFRRKSALEKQAINFPIQGTSAVIFKLASIYLFKYLRENDLLFKVKLCIPAHDEWNIEVPEEITEQMTNVLQDCMEKAGSYFVKKVKLPAEPEVAKYWVH